MITVEEFSHAHSLLIAIVEKELGRPRILPESVKMALDLKSPAAVNKPVSEDIHQWLELQDLAVSPHMLRRYITDSHVEEPAIRALIRFLVAKNPHSQDDRNKVDWLATHLVRVRQERRQQPIGWPRTEVDEILQGMELPALTAHTEDLLTELPSLLDEVKYLERFSQITDSRIIERARDLKDELGEEFFHPDVLTAIVNYNLTFGRKFHQLLQETVQKIREFLQAQPESLSPNTQELLESDYRTTTGAFQHLSTLGRKPEPEKRAEETLADRPGLPSEEKHTKEAVAPLLNTEKELIGLGIDPGRQGERLRNRVREIALRLISNPRLTFIPTPLGSLRLEEWESAALQADYPVAEESFRAAFARSVSTAIGVMMRIDEELQPYHETRGHETVWKQHHDALVYLLYEGRRLKAVLTGLSADSQKRGLPDKSKQLHATAEKLEASLSKLTTIF